MGSTRKYESLPLKTRISIAVLSIVTDTCCRRDGTVNRSILNFLKFASPANQNPVNGVSSFDVVVDSGRKLWYRVFVPTAQATLASHSIPVIVFFHGGGFVFLSADLKSYDAVCRRFARKIGAVVVSVNYRLAPEHRYPAQYDDGFDVLRFLDDEKNLSNGLPKNADLSRCFLAGDSAGANLAHHVALRFSQTNFQRLKVTGLVAIQPFFGGEERTDAELRLSLIVSIKRTDFFWKAFLPEVEALAAGRDHEAINVSGPRAVDLSGVDQFPPVLVVIGGRDPLRDWQRRYHDWLGKNGKEVELLEYPSMIHAFYLFPELHESGQAIDQIKDFINRRSA